jgi:hypothetical protein
MIKHGWQIGEEMVERGLFTKIFTWINEWLKTINSPSSYSLLQSWVVLKISDILKDFETLFLGTCKNFIKNSGSFIFFFNILRIHSSSCFSQNSPHFKLSTDVLDNITFMIMWNVFSSFLLSEKGDEKTLQDISSPVGGCELLFNHFTESQKPTSSWSVKDDGLRCAIILSFLHAYNDIPSNYHPIFPAFKNEIEIYPSYNPTKSLFLSLSLLASTPSNRTILYNNGFHSVTFNLLVKEDTDNSSRMYASQALCNMTCEESADLRNTILNAESFVKLKSLMDQIICSSPKSTADKYVALKNAIVIENIFLILSNMLVGNKSALTSIMDSGFKSYIINHLSPDKNDEKRQAAENITNQQKSALRALHSITFHQTEHISILMSNNILTCVKMAMEEKEGEIMELAMCGVLYNIAVKGNVGVQENKTTESEVKLNPYLKEYEEEEGLMMMISNAAKMNSSEGGLASLSTITTRTRQYATLIIGQLFRNRKLKEVYKHIITTLKSLKNGNDSDLSFKAQNTLEMLSENAGV